MGVLCRYLPYLLYAIFSLITISLSITFHMIVEIVSLNTYTHAQEIQEISHSFVQHNRHSNMDANWQTLIGANSSNKCNITGKR